MAEDMFNGFDHTQYKDEVEERWGKDAYAKGDSWWRGMGADEKAAWKQRSQQLGEDWIAAATAGIAPDSAEAQALAKRHVEWLTGIPGTPASDARGAGVTSRGTSPASARCTLWTRGSPATTAARTGPASSGTP